MDRPNRLTTGVFDAPPICGPGYDPARKFRARATVDPDAPGAVSIAMGVAGYSNLAINSSSRSLRRGQSATATAEPGASAPSAAHASGASVAADATGERTGERFTAEFEAGARGALLEELIAVMGTPAAARLVAAFGGTRLYVPQTPDAGDALSGAVGHEAAIALAQIYGGDRLEVPNPTPRRVRIAQMRADGISVDAIARSLGCTRRRVFQVLAEARANNRVP
ncbi:MAG: helix-turn-helix domain-containing protein [Candidatus Binataceae bacterium]|nr:helix-turn-helix domain-containing protein [Candidatus Binataceae bacterium]